MLFMSVLSNAVYFSSLSCCLCQFSLMLSTSVLSHAVFVSSLLCCLCQFSIMLSMSFLYHAVYVSSLSCCICQFTLMLSLSDFPLLALSAIFPAGSFSSLPYVLALFFFSLVVSVTSFHCWLCQFFPKVAILVFLLLFLSVLFYAVSFSSLTCCPCQFFPMVAISVILLLSVLSPAVSVSSFLSRLYKCSSCCLCQSFSCCLCHFSPLLSLSLLSYDGSVVQSQEVVATLPSDWAQGSPLSAPKLHCTVLYSTVHYCTVQHSSVLSSVCPTFI